MGHFRSDNKDIYLLSPYAEFYIPLDYFSGNVQSFAEDRGQTMHVFGVFNVAFFDESNKLIEMRLMNLPTWIDINVNESTTGDVKLLGDTTPTRCKILKYMKGAKIMPSTVIKDSSNAETFLSLVTKGSIPHAVPYNKAKTIWQKNLDLNDAHLGVPSVILELILSASYRYAKNPILKFAYAYGDNPSLTMYDYVMNSVRQICQNTSTYTAITFEDIDSMMIASVNRTTHKKTELQSPVEELLKL